MPERRLTIIFLGFIAVSATVGVIVLAAMSKSVPELLTTIAVAALGILAPSPLSKTAVPDQ